MSEIDGINNATTSGGNMVNQGTKVANLFSIFFHPILLAIRIFIKKYQISYLTAMDQMWQLQKL